MEPAYPLGLTVLRCVFGKRAAKRFFWQPKLGTDGAWGEDKYDAGWEFIPSDHHFADLQELADFLDKLRHDHRAFVVRGGLSDAALAQVNQALATRHTPRIRRYLTARPNHPATLIDLPRRWVMFDIDKWPLRPSDDLVDDPEGAIEHAIHKLLPEQFHNADYFWALSSSAGIKLGVLKAHLFFILTEPATNRHLKAVFKQHAPGVDLGLFNAIQAHYTADPLIEGRPDPIPRRTGWHEGLERAAELPALVKQEPRPHEHGAAGGIGGAVDVAGALAHLGYGEGGEGFHAPLRGATWAYAMQCDQHGKSRDDQALKDMLWDAIQAAPCYDGRDIQALYRDSTYLQGLIDGAFRSLADNPQHPSRHPKLLTTAQEIAAATVPLTGPPGAPALGEYHLKQVLGVPPRKDARAGGFSCWPDSIRYHPGQRAIVAVAYADDGSVQAIRRLSLAEDGSAAGPAETVGVTAGAIVRLPGDPAGPLLLANSVRNGLAAWGSTQHEVWITLEGFNDVSPPSGRLAVFVADDYPRRHDARHGGAAKHLHKAVRTFRHAGLTVATATPTPVRLHSGFTFADAILQHGTVGVAERIEAAIAPARTPIVRMGVYEAQRIVAAHTQSFTAEVDARSASMIEQKKASRKKRKDTSLDEVWDAVADAAGFMDASTQPTEPPAFIKAIGVDVGVGKSTSTREEFAKLLTSMRARGDKRTVSIAVPDHALGEQQKQKWTDLIKAHSYNLTVEVWRSRDALDPTHPSFLNRKIPKENKAAMCADPERTEDAKSVSLSVQEAVCLRKTKDSDGEAVELKCPLFDTCSFQAQREKKADIWITAHSSLTHKKPEALGELAALVVDEASWLTGLIGAETDGDGGDDAAQYLGFPLLALGNESMGALRGADRERLLYLRQQLFVALGGQPNSPLRRETFLIAKAQITADMAAEAKTLELGRKLTGLNPGQTKEERKEAMADLQGNKTIGRMVMAWDAIRLLLAPNGPERSGWIELATEQHQDVNVRMVRLKKRGEIAKGWQVPTMGLDAILNAEMLRPYWPTVEVLADVRVTTPHQRIFQVIDRAYSQAMLKPLKPAAAKENPEEDQRRRNRLADLRTNLFHLARYYAPGEVLVILQLSVKDALLALGPLPPNVLTAHHNNVAGRDEWRHVRAAVLVGRTQPSPAAVERIAEALTGRAVENRIPAGEWYHRVDAVRELGDGSSLLDETDRHPDAICEAIRWHVCEGQIVQGIGRTRGVWRTAETPCDVWVLTDLVLPLPVDGLIHAEWLKPTLDQEMIAGGGVVLPNSEHAAAVFLGLGKNAESRAEQVRVWSAKGGTFLTKSVGFPFSILLIGESHPPCHECPTLRRVDYQVAGKGGEPAVAWFDPALCPDVTAFLTAKLSEKVGKLAWCRVEDVPLLPLAVEQPGAAAVNVPPFAAVPAVPAPPSNALLPPAARMMETGGAVLTASRDAFEVYGALWKNGDAARKAFQRAGVGVGFTPAGLRRVDYLRAGRGQQPAVAWLDPTRDPDEIRTFLVERLGALARWDVASLPKAAADTPVALALPDLPSLGHNGAPPLLPEPPAMGDLPRIEAAHIPEVAAYAAPDGHTLLAECPFCDMPHRHGGFGPRHAHCASAAGRVYVLRDAGPASAALLALPMNG